MEPFPPAEPAPPVPATPTWMLWTGRVLSFLPALMLLADGVMKLHPPQKVVEMTTQIGFAESVIVPLGAVLTASVILYLVPKTMMLGAILLTGYLGGAVCIHVLKGDGPFEIFFPAGFGAVLWLGLVFRSARLRSLLPVVR